MLWLQILLQPEQRWQMVSSQNILPGAGSTAFGGVRDNTDIGRIIIEYIRGSK